MVVADRATFLSVVCGCGSLFGTMLRCFTLPAYRTLKEEDADVQGQSLFHSTFVSACRPPPVVCSSCGRGRSPKWLPMLVACRLSRPSSKRRHFEMSRHGLIGTEPEGVLGARPAVGNLSPRPSATAASAEEAVLLVCVCVCPGLGGQPVGDVAAVSRTQRECGGRARGAQLRSAAIAVDVVGRA